MGSSDSTPLYKCILAISWPLYTTYYHRYSPLGISSAVGLESSDAQITKNHAHSYFYFGWFVCTRSFCIGIYVTDERSFVA